MHPMPEAAAPRTLLVVDDEPATRQLLALLLEQCGYHVLTAADGLEGLHLAQAHCPSMILLDLMMPRLGGYELLRRVKSDPGLQRVRVIILSAKGSESDMAESARLGALCHLEKPYEVEELLRRISEGLTVGEGEARHGE
jgi:twitching motility two-component system response regulator PilH